MNWTNEIVTLAKNFRGLENSEISVNEATQNIALYDCKKQNSYADHILDICPLRVFDLDNLRNALDEQNIVHTL